MAAKHGRRTVILVNSINLSGFCDNSEYSQEVDTHETTVYGEDNKTYITGLRDGTLTISGRYDDGADNPKDTIEAIIDGDAAVPIVRRVEGTGSGLPEDSFSGIIESYVETSPVGDKVTWSADIQITGAITRGTQP